MSAGPATGYAIARFTGVCAATGAAIEPGQAYVAALLETSPDGPLERRDFTLEGWSASERPKGLFACWRARRREREEQVSPLIDDEELLNLFFSLDESAGERQAAFRYALALLLMRRRLLRQVGAKGPGGSTLLLKQRGASPEEPPIELRRPDLDAQACAALVDELGALLRGES